MYVDIVEYGPVMAEHIALPWDASVSRCRLGSANIPAALLRTPSVESPPSPADWALLTDRLSINTATTPHTLVLS